MTAASMSEAPQQQTRCLNVLTSNLPAPDEAAANPPPQPPLPGFDDVTVALERLRAAVGTAGQGDLFQLTELLHWIRSLFPGVLGAVEQQVGDPEPLGDRIHEGMRAVEEFVRDTLEPHRDVPERLGRISEATRTAAERLSAMGDEVEDLRRREEWSGEAAEGYGRVAAVQAGALAELRGMHEVSANCLERVALLNRAAFFYAAEAINFTAMQVENSGTGPSTELFSRSQHVDGLLRALLGKLETEIVNVGSGEAAVRLAQEIDQAVAAPALLQTNAWPTGGRAADTEPVDVANLVRAAADPQLWRSVTA